MGTKITAELTIDERHAAWLEQMASRHDLEDRDKALRVLLEYAIQEGDEAAIFEPIRCHGC